MPSPISSVRSLVDPLKSYQYRVQVTPIPAGVGINSQELSLRCRATELPGSSVNIAKVELAGHTLNYGTLREYEPWTMRVVEGLNATILKGISLWHDLIFNPATGAGNNKSLYESTAVVQAIDNTGAVVLTRTLFGVIPEKVSPIEFSQERPGRAVEATITWVYDFYQDT